MMAMERAEDESLIRRRIAQEETFREKVDEDGNRWVKVYLGGGAHLSNWLSQIVELKGKDNVRLEEIDSSGFQCFEKNSEKMCRIWVRDTNMGQTKHC
jgi:hypothetical protein